MIVTRYWDVGAGLVILLGMMQLPGDMIVPGLLGAGAGLGRIGSGLAFVDLVPVLPFLIALSGLAGGRIGGGTALWLILATCLPAALLTLGASYDSGGGGGIILMEGVALTLACWGMLLCLAGRVTWGRLTYGLAVLVALWSLTTPFFVASSVRAVAEQDAYCIARHEPDRPILSWAELRGVSFHTNQSGFKDTSEWYLHGVLLVQRAGGVEAWNWSPRHMRFRAIGPGERPYREPFRHLRADGGVS